MSNRKSRQAIPILLCLFSFLSLTGCSLFKGPPPPPPAAWSISPGFSQGSISKIAIIVEIANQSPSEENPLATQIEEFFINAAFQKGYRVADRSDVAKVLKEIRFQNSGLTGDDAAQLGKMLNVSAVLLVNLPGYGVQAHPTGFIVDNRPYCVYDAWANMDVRLIGVESSEILAISDYNSKIHVDGPQDPGPAIGIAARQIAEALPPHQLQ